MPAISTTLMRALRNTHFFAYWQGFFEHLRYSGMGRSHPEDDDWNEAYDGGWNLADKLMGRTPDSY